MSKREKTIQLGDITIETAVPLPTDHSIFQTQLWSHMGPPDWAANTCHSFWADRKMTPGSKFKEQGMKIAHIREDKDGVPGYRHFRVA